MMRTAIKNGKLHTINIYGIILLLNFIFPCSIHATHPGFKKEGKWVIVIDPGHGGKDSGANGLFSKEKDVNLAIALKTGDYIEQNCKNVTVIYTRQDDSTVDLIERPKIANRNNADLFISIHANSTKVSRSVMGAETYIMGPALNQENLEVAMKENEVILLEDDYSVKYQNFDPKSEESYIIFSLTQNTYRKQSTDLAWKIQTQFTENVNRKDRGVKQAGFWVLYNTSMPSVLVETAFISNQAEEKYLNSKTGQEYLASAIYRACRDYMNEIDRRSVNPAAMEPGPQTINQVTEVNKSAGELAFMVQVNTTASKIEIKPENFKGLTDIIEINANDRYKYATGNFSEFSDAVRYRKKVELIYPGAFVIAVKDNKILPLQQALEQKRKK